VTTRIRAAADYLREPEIASGVYPRQPAALATRWSGRAIPRCVLQMGDRNRLRAGDFSAPLSHPNMKAVSVYCGPAMIPTTKPFPESSVKARTGLHRRNLPVPFDKRVWNEDTALARAGYGVTVICPVGKGTSCAGSAGWSGDLSSSSPLEADGALGYALGTDRPLLEFV